MELTVPKKPDNPYADLWVFVTGYWENTGWGAKQFFWYPKPAVVIEHYRGARARRGTTEIVDGVLRVTWDYSFPWSGDSWKEQIAKNMTTIDPYPEKCVSEWPRHVPAWE